MSLSSIKPAHISFPLTRQALDRLSLTPEFEYLDPYNARQLNDRLKPPLPDYTPGEISAVGLIGKVYLHVIDLFLVNSPSLSFQELDEKLKSGPGATSTDNSLAMVLDHFPTTPTHYSPASTSDYLLTFSGSANQRYGLYKSLLLIFLADSNPALRKKDNLFTDPDLRQSADVSLLRKALIDYFSNQVSFFPGGKSLIDFLLEPAIMHPDSLFQQLAFIRQNWVSFLGEDYLIALLKVLDQIKEEWIHIIGGKADPQDPLGYTQASYLSDVDPIRFSDDLDWMPRVILIAKNIFVWLDQLSKEYQRSIHQLNHIPDEELAKLSSWGITGLWLIGLWQRSSASQKIKQICGNPDAVPSAYSLYDYVIADSLGGETAYHDLRTRAARFNIRLAADMVPNHMGIYSKWVLEHPDWFLSVDKPPFPGYTFQGTDLSDDPRVGIFLEDHYYDKTDAAVVFKRLDRNTGGEKFIYHGNDGTSMPWNDTAQLDFLNPEVKEAVIQNILHVARKFPIIRFDAAMTLAKKHIQRLWFPEPGSGGAIPTRSEFGFSNKEFDRLMPEEFWREVVDRVASEAPDTLLLAEAFWMMEGYFVRTLGMHRVYNSAFMHMLRDEDNHKYRELIIKTLEYDPQILKRYVNFMNNPDEDTAISQYGSDGKYFGVCVLMCTLPGLPMFGHGQVEGFAEKYGMEYQRAYYNENPNQALIERHQREIFPLLHKRYLFAEVDNFYLFDFVTENNTIDQNVFAFSNRSGDESALVIYHNKWGDTIGSIHWSTPVNGSTSSLLDALGLSAADGDFLLFRDQITGIEYIRPFPDLVSHGLHVFLGAYRYQVLVNFDVVSDLDGIYSRLYSLLGDNGVPSLHDAKLDLQYTPLSNQVSEVLSTCLRSEKLPFTEFKTNVAPQLQKLACILSDVAPGLKVNSAEYQTSVIHRLGRLETNFHKVFSEDALSLKLSSFLWSLFSGLLPFPGFPGFFYLANSLTKQSDFSTLLPSDCLSSMIVHSEIIDALAPSFIGATQDLSPLIETWLDPSRSKVFLGLNEYDGVVWFKKEIFESLLNLTITYFIFTEPKADFLTVGTDFSAQLIHFRDDILDSIKNTNYRVDKLYDELTLLISKWNSQAARSEL